MPALLEDAIVDNDDDDDESIDECIVEEDGLCFDDNIDNQLKDLARRFMVWKLHSNSRGCQEWPKIDCWRQNQLLKVSKEGDGGIDGGLSFVVLICGRL
jgi:hypothetical protein